MMDNGHVWRHIDDLLGEVDRSIEEADVMAEPPTSIQMGSILEAVRGLRAVVGVLAAQVEKGEPEAEARR
jgi:hypothetical protein